MKTLKDIKNINYNRRQEKEYSKFKIKMMILNATIIQKISFKLTVIFWKIKKITNNHSVKLFKII